TRLSRDLDSCEALVGTFFADLDLAYLEICAVSQNLIQHLRQNKRIDDMTAQLDRLRKHPQNLAEDTDRASEPENERPLKVAARFGRSTSGTYRNWSGGNWRTGGNWRSGGNWSGRNWRTGGNWSGRNWRTGRNWSGGNWSGNQSIFIGGFGFPFFYGYPYYSYYPYNYYGYGSYPYGYGYDSPYGYGYDNYSAPAYGYGYYGNQGYGYGDQGYGYGNQGYG